MPSEIIAIQFGQCGNQIGDAFWRALCTEHGIAPDGTLSQEEIIAHDLKRADDAHYVPRAVLVDLEPRVINSIMNEWCGCLFGYFFREAQEVLFEMLEREAENSGTGSGMGSYALEKISDRLIEHPNCVVVLDNTALHRIASENAPTAPSASSFALINSLVGFPFCLPRKLLILIPLRLYRSL
uniref:Tubulin/FtsZ GTPase domain-containing protein n=1 Tax=Parascaris equorum TaxID=6256 RepID=A0A914SDI1_PAREQ